jgi:crotonobetainyl-CoA:carnitine CoA-transferase CaiB-like acyl-CoA transferase
MTDALQGVTVLEVSGASPGGFCTMLLACMGAEVLKIEPPAADKRSVASAYLDRNKKSLGLDLDSAAGQEILHQLAGRADVLVESFRPGAMQRLNADYPALSRINSRLIYCSLSGYGQTGPYRDLPGSDVTYLAMSGVLDLIGEADRPPAIPLNLIADYGGAAMHGAVGVLLALYARGNSGRGQHVDVSHLDATLSMLAATPLMVPFFDGGVLPRRGQGPYSGRYAFYTTYETQDGKLLSVGSSEPWLWSNLCEALDRPDLSKYSRGPEHLTRGPTPEEAQVREELQVVFRRRSRDDWLAYLADKNVCVSAVNTLSEVFEDPQVQHRGMLVQHEGSAGEGQLDRQVGMGIKLSDTPGRFRHSAPQPGQHTDEILSSLGYGESDLKSLREQRVVG